MNHIAWESIRDAFEHGRGCGREVRIRPADAAIWQAAYDLVLREYQPVDYDPGYDHPVALPSDVTVLLDRDFTNGVGLNFHVGQVGMSTWFSWDLGGVCFTFQPEDVNGPDELERMVHFVRRLAQVTRKSVLLTMENTKERVPEEVIFQCDPETLHITYNQPSTLWEWTEKRGWIWRGKWDRYPPPTSPPRGKSPPR